MGKIMSKIQKSFLIATVLMIGLALFWTPINAAAADKKPGKVTISSISSADYNAVKITWKKADYAKKYEVYRATASGGTYKKVKTTTSRSYTDSGLTTGKKYYYKVRALNGTAKGSYSSVKSATPKLKAIASFKAEKSSLTSIKLTWKKVNGAQKYQIYRSTSKNGEYTLIKTTDSTSYTNKDLTTKQTYYYKVRAYRVVNDVKKYSAYTSVKSVRLPLRDVSKVYEYEINEEYKEVKNMIFNDDVTIYGNNADIVFINCIFNGDIINRGELGTMVWIENTIVNGKCIIKNNLKEATIDTKLPKFLSFTTGLDVVCEECYGSAIVGPDLSITFNGEEYDREDSEFYYDAETQELVPYEGQEEAEIFMVGQWWEDGELFFLKALE